MSVESLNFLIYGTPDCTYCQTAKSLLSNLKIPYIYQDLTLIYENWKEVFTTLKPFLKGQTKIPIIFRSSEMGTSSDPSHQPHLLVAQQIQQGAPDNRGSIDSSLTEIASSTSTLGWTLVGGYFELESMLEDMEISLGDNY